MKKLFAVFVMMIPFTACQDEKIDNPTGGTYHETAPETKENETDLWDENTNQLTEDMTDPGFTTSEGNNEDPGLGGMDDDLTNDADDGNLSGGAPNQDNNPALSGEPGSGSNMGSNNN